MMIESNFQIRIGIEIKRTDKKTFFKVSSRIWFICSGVKVLELSTPSTLTNGGVQTIGGVGLLGPWSFPHFQHFSFELVN
ncbi:hypothetical protein [Acinetobacter baumannii]|uniref:hypothetical protein n=1 Tax=Acinetobacter baumannii TaxID=470 RepID=UPI001298B9EF|nr:hypothetical protein [Acinetobacter baumannii]